MKLNSLSRKSVALIVLLVGIQSVQGDLNIVNASPANLPTGFDAVLWQDFETAWTASNTPVGGFPATGWSKAILSNNTGWMWYANGIEGGLV